MIQERYKGEAFLRRDFIDELVDEPQIYPPSETIEDIHDRIDEMFLEAPLFKSAYSDLEVLGGALEGHVFGLDYRLKRAYRAYAYFKSGDGRSYDASCAVLAIPGSRHNLSTKALRKDPTDNHGNILEITERFGDTFIYIKPNQDILAIHNGQNKLDVRSVVPYLLNRGGSYAAHYIASTLAFTKHLQSRYERVYVVGVSQGGAATLYNALQSEPTAAVVASGFTVMNETYYRWSMNQIIIPGLDVDFGVERILSLIEGSPTRYLFTMGETGAGSVRDRGGGGLFSSLLPGIVECDVCRPRGRPYLPRG